MRRTWSICAALLLAITLGACSSDDGGDDARTTTTRATVDLADAKEDTPFCEAFVRLIRSFEDVATNTNPSKDLNLLVQVQVSYERVAASAPDAVKADADATSLTIESFDSIGDLLQMTPEQVATSERVNAYAEDECNLDGPSIRQQIEAIGSRTMSTATSAPE